MRRGIIVVIFSILLTCPAISRATDDITDTGRGTMFNYPLFKVPIGQPDSKSVSEKKEEEKEKNDEKDKKILDKKVDDAIDEAWKEK